MDLVFTIDSTEYLIDVTTIDTNNPFKGFLRDSGLSPSCFPDAASVIVAKKKWDKFRTGGDTVPANFSSAYLRRFPFAKKNRAHDDL